MTTTQKLIGRFLMRAGLLSVLVVAGAACSLEPSVPGSPTYTADVQPILEARCIRCHGFPSLGGARGRFDLYECPGGDAGAGDCVAAAKMESALMKVRVQLLGKDDPLHMPPKPAAPLSQYQVDTIAKWVDNGAPE